MGDIPGWQSMTLTAPVDSCRAAPVSGGICSGLVVPLFRGVAVAAVLRSQKPGPWSWFGEGKPS